MYRKGSDRQSFTGRRILPAAQDPSIPTGQAGNDVDNVLGKPKPQLPRRTVTAVACNLCKARKSKCDGERPVCRACFRRGQPNECQYDANSDQRRTAALKDRIAELRGLTDDLKLIIITLVRDRTHSSLNEICEELIRSDFVDVQRVAQLLQSDPTLAQLAQQERLPLSTTSSYPQMDGALSPELQHWTAMSSAGYTTSHPAYATAASSAYYQDPMSSTSQMNGTSAMNGVPDPREQQQQQQQQQSWYPPRPGNWPT